MAEKEYCVISVDLGTSGVRACLVDQNLSILYQVQEPIELITDINGKVEQDPNEVLDAAFSVIQNAAKYASDHGNNIIAISFSNAVSSLVQVDRNLNPIGNYLTYADLRSFKETEDLRTRFDKNFFMNSGVPLHASYWMPKILWLRNENRIDDSTKYFCTIKDLLVQRLTGQFFTDFSNAVATGITDASQGDWNRDNLDFLEIETCNLPEIHPTTEVIQLLPEVRKSLSLADNVRIILGATDGVLSSLGAGAIHPGEVTTMIGSSGACRIASESPLLTTGENVTWSYPLADGIWIRGGAMNSGGLVYQWMSERFFSDYVGETREVLSRIFKNIQKIPPGSDGLIFLPYIFGERAPIWNEKARGVYFGIHESHNRDHFARATFEGIIFALFSIFNIIKSNIKNEINIRATGGYTRSKELLQIQTDVFGSQVHVPENHEGSSIGAALLAFFATGIFDSLEQGTKLIKITETLNPIKENKEKYQESYKKFKEIYLALMPVFE